jgi:hypothetical protein
VAKKSKKFRVAREGATTDGRKIDRKWLEQMAKNYDPKVYGARINLEHIKGYHPDSPFRAYGDVLSLSTEEDKGKMFLLAEISPTDDLVAMNKKRQKVYTSIEIDTEFADLGEAYMVGLAVTDDPASLGTEMLEFSAGAKSNPLAYRKTRPENLFTAVEEVTLEFIEDEDESDSTSLQDTVTALFKKHNKSTSAEFESFRKDLEKALELVINKFSEGESTLPTEFSDLKKAHEKLQDDFDALYKKLDSTDGRQNHRTTATGNNGNLVQTDC